MSRVGKKPVVIPSGVDIKISGKEITVKGPKGTLTQALHPDMTIEQEGNEILVKRPSDQKEAQSASWTYPLNYQQYGDRRDRWFFKNA